MATSHFFHLLLLFLFQIIFSYSQQLSTSQSQTLVRLQQILEYPPLLSSWSRHASFCNLPYSPSLSVSCSSTGQIIGLSILGDGHQAALSTNFSSDSLFTTLSRLSSLSSLSLVSLGIWGPLPSKIKRLSSLKELNLSSNYFNGTVPDLKSMAPLSTLDLGGNFLGPEFPSLANNIETLILRNNFFRAELAMADLASLDRLQKLDLSSNQFTGPIPPLLFSVSTVRYLNLSNNKLQGALPTNLSCGSDLKFVDISRNLLVGSLPSCIQSNSSNLVVFNSWNCFSSEDLRYQHPNSYCTKKPLAAMIPVANGNSGSKNNLSLVLGIVGGIIGGGLLIGLLLFLFLRKVKLDSEGMQFLDKKINGKNSIHLPKGTPADARHMSQGVIIERLGVTPYRIFTIEELDEATNGFDSSSLVSEGPQGQSFKGCLQDGSTVLVRTLKLKQKYSSQSLLQYIEVVSKLRHRHLVSILGHCISISEGNANSQAILFLIFENISNGTLRSHLTEWRKCEMLKWPQRVRAVIGVARGLQFLHTVTVECESPFDFGENGDFCSFQTLESGEKEDILQLGLILLEVITGKPPGTQREFDALRVQLQKSLNEPSDKLGTVVDPTIRNTFAHESLRRAAEICINCVSKDTKDRPSIDDVLWNLQYCVQIQDGWASNENLSTQS